MNDCKKDEHVTQSIKISFPNFYEIIYLFHGIYYIHKSGILQVASCDTLIIERR